MSKVILSSKCDYNNVNLDNGIYRYSSYSGNSIIFGGVFTSVNGVTLNRLCKIFDNGELDTNFNNNLGTGFNNIIRMVHVESSGKIIVSGDFTTFNGNARNYIVRLNSDGTEDVNFYNTVGKFNKGVFKIINTSDGGYLYGGMFTSWNGTTHNRLIKFNSDYTLNTSFNNNINTACNNHVVHMLTDSLGKYVIVGNFTSFNGNTRYQIIRLNTDGTEDSTFYNNVNPTQGNKGLIYMCSDNKLLITEWYSAPSGGLMKLNTDGTIDTTFQNNWSKLDDSAVLDIQKLPNNKLLLGGGFTSYNSQTRNRLFSIDENGTEDTNFYNTLTNWGNGSAFDNTIYMNYITSDKNNIFIGGYYTSVNGVTYNRVSRITVSGLNNSTPTPLKILTNNNKVLNVN